MGHHYRDRRRGFDPEQSGRDFGPASARQQRRSEWGGWGHPGAQGGPPPWVSGLFGMGGRGPGRGRGGPRARRGDVRSAILDVLRQAVRSEESLNGYQVIGKITELSGEAWTPSPGSVYPTIQQLQDEGLVSQTDDDGRKSLRLTAEGVAYVEAHPEELAAVWAPFAQDCDEDGRPQLKPEVGQVMGAVWQIVSQGSPAQQQAAIEILAETRRKLYGVLADGPDQGD